MRKLLLFILSSLLLFSTVYGQEIYGDFNQEWVSDTKGNGALPGQYLRPGKQPVGWEASNVNQKVWMEAKEELVFSDTDRTGGEGFSAKMVNSFVGVNILGSKIGSIAPAYISLGVPWVFAISDIPNCDGGTLGGIAYTERPDSLVGYYKRTIVDDSENAAIIAYLWKGTTTSTVKTNPSGGLSSNATTQVTDQDVCILGKKAYDSKSDDFTLIATAEYKINGTLDEWTRIAVPIEYLTEDTPEKANVIISAANYWDRIGVKEDNILWADDVEFITNPKLKSLKVGGANVSDFHPRTYQYALAGELQTGEVEAIPMDEGATVSGIQEVGKRKIITVTSADGERTCTYTLYFGVIETELVVPTVTGAVYGNEIDYVISSNNDEDEIIIKFSDPSIVKIENGKMQFTRAGQTKMTVSQEGSDDYFPITYTQTIQVNQAPLTVTVNDATSKYGVLATYSFTYDGLTPADELLLADDPSEVFTTLPQASAYNGSSKVSTTTTLGTYPIRFTNTPVAPNYEIVLVAEGKNLIIGKGEARVSLKVTRKQGEENPEFKIEIMDFKGLVQSADRTYNSTTKTYYPKTGTTTGTIIVSFAGEIPNDEWDAGTYPITLISTLESAKYDFIMEESELVIEPALFLKLTNFPEEVVYGDEFNVELKANGDVEDLTFTYAAVQPTGDDSALKVSFDNNKMTTVGAGNAKISLTVSADGFDSKTITKEFAVQKAPLTITAEDATRYVGDANPEFTLSYQGFQFEEDEETAGVFTAGPVGVTIATESSLAGEYPITITAEAPNYAITPVNATLTVEKREVEVSFVQTRKQGEENPALTIENMSFTGLLEADANINAVTGTSYPKTDVLAGGSMSAVYDDAELNDESPAGQYTVSINSTPASDKYSFTIAENNYLEVTPALFLKLIDFPTEVVYGDVVSVEVRSNSDIEDILFGYEAVEPEGDSSPLKVNFLENEMTAIGAGNAKIKLTAEADGFEDFIITREFEVQKAPLTVTAENASRKVGEENPEFVITYNGFQFDEDENTPDVFVTVPTATTTADVNSSQGTYDIVVSGEAVNYEIIPVDGILTVQPSGGVGIDSPVADGVNVFVSNGILYIKGNIQKEKIAVYNTLGMLLETSNEVEAAISGLPMNNLCVVKVGKNVVKVLIQ